MEFYPPLFVQCNIVLDVNFETQSWLPPALENTFLEKAS